jgi:hypothetical protein
MSDAFGGTATGVQALEGLSRLENAPVAHAMIEAVTAAPHGDVQMRATNLPAE